MLGVSYKPIFNNTFISNKIYMGVSSDCCYNQLVFYLIAVSQTFVNCSWTTYIEISSLPKCITVDYYCYSPCAIDDLLISAAVGFLSFINNSISGRDRLTQQEEIRCAASSWDLPVLIVQKLIFKYQDSHKRLRRSCVIIRTICVASL